MLLIKDFVLRQAGLLVALSAHAPCSDYPECPSRMTLYISLDAANDLPNSPPFLLPSGSPDSHLTTVIQAILKAKRIAVVCGAGISVEAGIPDFRSQDGLFKSLKRDHPKESLSSGKDLFDASVFKSTQKTALFFQMIARLSTLSSQGQPTAFHQLLRALDERKQLLRVYTQNIDALEMKAGLSFGVPQFEEKSLRLKLKGKAKVKAKETGSGAYNARLGGRRGKPLADIGTALPPPSSFNDVDSSEAGPSTPPRRDTPTSSASPNTESQLNVIPRCIPLHGTLLTLHCQHCTQTFPLDPPSPHSVTSRSPPPSPIPPKGATHATSLHSLLALGTPPPCPSCTSLEQTRALVGKRLRGIGKLRPSVVLYGEEHREGEGVGEAVRRDLCGITDSKAVFASPEKLDAGTPSRSRARAGKGPDLLLVVGTSLRVPGTKRIVREFSKAVRPPSSPSPSCLPTPSPSPPATADSPPEQIRTVYLNLEFPLPSREWEGVFDVWVNGDAQVFAKAVTAVIREEEQRQARKKEKSVTKPHSVEGGKSKLKPKNTASSKAKGKRKAEVPETPVRPSKKRKLNVDIPPTPVSLPKRKDKRIAEAEPHTPKRRVILRLPPPPLPTKPPLRRKRSNSVAEVVIKSHPVLFARRPARSLSPLTSLPSSRSSSLSDLTPLPSAVSSDSSPGAVNLWRKNISSLSMHNGTRGPADSEEEDIPLSQSFPRRNNLKEGCRSGPLKRPPLKYAYVAKANGFGDRSP